MLIKCSYSDRSFHISIPTYVRKLYASSSGNDETVITRSTICDRASSDNVSE